jgi:hypothetical protein
MSIPSLAFCTDDSRQGAGSETGITRRRTKHVTIIKDDLSQPTGHVEGHILLASERLANCGDYRPQLQDLKAHGCIGMIKSLRRGAPTSMVDNASGRDDAVRDGIDVSIRFSASQALSSPTQEDDAVRVEVLKKKPRATTTPNDPSQRSNATGATPAAEDDRRPENGAVILLKRVRSLVSKLKDLQKVEEDSMLNENQRAALNDERAAVAADLDRMRQSDGYRTLVKVVGSAETTINSGRGDELVAKLNPYRGFFGNAFLQQVQLGNVGGIRATGTTLVELDNLDLSAQQSSASLESIEKSLDSAINFFRGDADTPPDEAWAMNRPIHVELNDLGEAVKALDPHAVSRELLKSLKESPKEAVSSIGPIDNERARNLLYGDKDRDNSTNEFSSTLVAQ